MATQGRAGRVSRRRTDYKCLARFEKDGLEGLKEKSQAPHVCPHRTSEAVKPPWLRLGKPPHLGPER
jgi:hypothetical protein